MTCTQINRQLKCKFPPCPCQKCSKLRGLNGNNRSGHNCDTPPERPIPKYRLQGKSTCEPEIIRPKFERKCPPSSPPHRRPSNESQESCLEGDDCNTGLGCCNTKRNFLTFMINMIGFVAFVIISAIILWLLVLKWAVILGIKVYNSNRNTQVAVVSVISLLFLMILYTAGIKGIRKSFVRPATAKLQPKPVPPPTLHISANEEPSTSMFSFRWGRSKDIGKQPEARSSWLPSFRKGTVTKTPEVSSTWMSTVTWSRSKEIKKVSETRSSWMPSSRWIWSRSKETKEEIQTPSSWMPSTRWIWSRSKETKQKIETPSSWMPSTRWIWSRSKETKQKIETPSSWMPSFRKTQSSPKEPKEAAVRSSWMDFTKRNRKEIELPPKSSLWITTFSWYRSTTKSIDDSHKKPQALITWSPYNFDWGHTAVVQVQTSQKKDSSPWITSFPWYHSTTQPVHDSQKKPQALMIWSPYNFDWGHTAAVQAKTSKKKYSSWISSFSWYHSTTKSVDNSHKKPQALFTWSPYNFDWGHPAAVQVKNSKTKGSSPWIPSFIWGQSEKKKTIPCKTACKKSPCETKNQKVTVTITDEEARQIFKKSKLYAIPTEMKQPPTLIIYLRDLIQGNSD